jgi:hypothetical protein
MLIEAATSVSVTDKELFISLCQTYEPNSLAESSTLASRPYSASPYPTTSPWGLAQENIRQQLRENEQSKDRVWWMLRQSFAVMGFADSDWTKSW